MQCWQLEIEITQCDCPAPGTGVRISTGSLGCTRVRTTESSQRL